MSHYAHHVALIANFDVREHPRHTHIYYIPVKSTSWTRNSINISPAKKNRVYFVYLLDNDSDNIVL